jgi:hypothetical protein
MGALLGRLRYWLSFRQAPEPGARERLFALLRERPNLSADEWFTQFGPRGLVRRDVGGFVLQLFRDLMKIDGGRVRPGDRLVEDLGLGTATWSDWEFDMAEQFESQFHFRFTRERPFPHTDNFGEFLAALSRYLDEARGAGET